jgi:hypothetical protein
MDNDPFDRLRQWVAGAPFGALDWRIDQMSYNPGGGVCVTLVFDDGNLRHITAVAYDIDAAVAVDKALERWHEDFDMAAIKQDTEAKKG